MRLLCGDNLYHSVEGTEQGGSRLGKNEALQGSSLLIFEAFLINTNSRLKCAVIYMAGES